MNAFTASKVPARLVAPSHRPWEPWGYQTRGVAHLMGHSAAALFLDPGLGKTAITLAAFQALKERGHAERMLVVAPLRVCQLVWRQEGAKWSQFRELSFSLLHGPKKAERLKDDVDIHLINPDGIPWLARMMFGRRDIPWDTVALDELTKWKNARAPRSMKLHKLIRNVQRRWGLTGSPAPNGYMDLFGQMMMLDDGAALGKYITAYRDAYFQPDFNGYDYTLRRGMAEKIEERIAPYVLRMAAADYLDLPSVRDNVIEIQLPPDALKQYKQMERDMVLALPEGVVTGANSGAVYSKLAQMANGAVYLSERDGEYVEVHDAKLAALEELIEELSGQPLLVGYEFKHDLERIRARLGDVPTLSGLSGTRITELEAAWNRGEVPVLLAHPASAGHGLNLQGSADFSPAHVCWFSQPWDLELYEQFIARIHRQGNEASHITNHIFRVRGTIDDAKAEALGEKDTTQQGLLARLNAEILRDMPASTAARAAQNEETTMAEVRKLGFNNPQAQQAAGGDVPVRPRGWGAPAQEEEPQGVSSERMRELAGVQTRSQTRVEAPAEEAPRPRGWGLPAGAAPDPQREAIREKISAPPVQEVVDGGDEDVPASVRALRAFGPGIVEALEGDGEESAQNAPHPTLGHDMNPTTQIIQHTAATDKQWSAPATHAPAETGAVAQQATEAPKRTRRKKDTAVTAQDGGVGSAGGNKAEPLPVTAGYTEEMEAERTFRHAEIAASDDDEEGADDGLPYINIHIEVQGLNHAALGALFGALSRSFTEG